MDKEQNCTQCFQQHRAPIHHKACLMEHKGELKGLSQVFCCIYVLLKALLENGNNDVPEVKLQKKDYKEKQAGSENNILDWHPVSLPISSSLLPSLTKGNSL